METYLFYLYLKFAKENKQTFWPKLFGYSKSIVVMFVLAMISFVILIISAFLNWNIVSLTTSVLEVFFITLLIRLLNNYRIDFGDSEYEKYEEYCIKLFGFLKHFKVKEDNLSEIHENICKKIDCLKLEEEKSQLRFDKWLQSLIIPAVLAIVTTIITKQDDVTNMILYTIDAVVIFAIIYCGISIFKTINEFPEKHRIKQMECFASDLKSIMFFIKRK